MCLVVLAHNVHPELPLIVAANRDEFHARPAQKLHWWVDSPDILAGRDLQGGGTWLGLHRDGRFATVTNYRDADAPQVGRLTRGKLVADFLNSSEDPLEYVRRIDGGRYAGFNLIVADTKRIAYLSNRDGGYSELAPGVYGLANATLDSAWPKVERAKCALDKLLASDQVNETALMRLLGDRVRANARDIEANGGSFDRAHALSAPFIVMPDYGTRCSTVLTRNSEGQVRISEARFAADGLPTGQTDFAYAVGNSEP